MSKILKTTVTGFVFHKNKLLLIKHKKSGKWLPVGGHAEENETLDETLHREIKEEVNLGVKFIEKYDYYGDISFGDGFKELPKPFYVHVKENNDHRRMSFDFVCICEDISNLKILESELDDFKWFSKEEIKTDSKLWDPVRVLALNAFQVYDNYIK
jgi:8-oxo-dGTP pyrophosphatase MutT (NUDIX family)